MRFLLAFIASCFIALHCHAQTLTGEPPKNVTGTFYVSVDDGATIYVNGKKVHGAGIGESRSGELVLSQDDRIVVQLRDDGGGRRFMMTFVSTDRKTVVSFRHRNFKNIPDLDVTDFTVKDFERLTKFAKEEKHKPVFPFKDYSEWIWGDLSKGSIGCMVTPEMIKPMPK